MCLYGIPPSPSGTIQYAKVKKVELLIYHQEPDKSRNERILIKSLVVNVESAKRLTASRASKIIKRELPRFQTAGSVLVIETDYGWEARRTIKPSEKCSFHYKWEYALVLKEKST